MTYVQPGSPQAASATAPPDHAIAVIGAACRYPGGCDDLETFWRLLRGGGSAISAAAPERWSTAFHDADPNEPRTVVPNWGGFLADSFPAGFDAAFFNIPPAEAQALDPQQRLLLEVGWRALEAAGIPIEPESGCPIGVFVGISTADYHGAQLWQPELKAITQFTATGASFAAAAGRLSYCFGFNGPSLAVDTACSSSLVAFHLACQSLRDGDCEAALIAGVNALLTPNLFVCLTKMGLLSPDGRCKAFDASGNGYVRSEGCGALVLKRFDHARRDGDAVLAICRGSAVNQDGRTNGLTAPSRPAQERVIGQALTRAGLSPGDVDYVEAHGTGTPLGDLTELSALAGAYASGRDKSAPLLVGSVKTNIGHLEAGAGMAGLIKAILCLRHGEIPPHPLLRQPTPHLDWDEVALVVPTAITPWPATGRPRRAGISAFGFSGTNAHVILEAPPAPSPRDRPGPNVVLLPISARDPAALDEVAAELAAWLEVAPRDLADLGLTLGVGRTAFPHRFAVVGSDAAELAACLRGGAARPVGGDPLRARLLDLARMWTSGAAVDWARLYRPFGARKLPLPGHPFHRQRHWSNPVASAPGVRGALSPRAAAIPNAPEAWRRLIDERARLVLSDQPLQPLDPELGLVEQGITSLLALQLREDLETVLARPLPATLLYNYPSINSIAEFLAGGRPAPMADRPSDTASSGVSPLAAAPDGNEFDFLDALGPEDLATLVEREVTIHHERRADC
jgi:acyl transferase domain-containing protein